MLIFYFTATGNSLSVAKKCGGDLMSIPQVVDLPDQNYRDDAIGFVFPIYAVTLPRIVSRFLEQASFNADYMFAIGTYGGYCGAAMLNLKEKMSKRGIKLNYVNSILMIDNYLPKFDIEKQKAKSTSQKIQKSIDKVVSDIQNRVDMIPKTSLSAKFITKLFTRSLDPSRTDNHAHGFIVNERCTKCGICAKVCPASNIRVSDKVCFNSRCEFCLACIHLCPQNALHLKNERSATRWCNPDVLLSEIIASNNRVIPD
jgi:ferredoxin